MSEQFVSPLLSVSCSGWVSVYLCAHMQVCVYVSLLLLRYFLKISPQEWDYLVKRTYFSLPSHCFSSRGLTGQSPGPSHLTLSSLPSKFPFLDLAPCSGQRWRAPCFPAHVLCQSYQPLWVCHIHLRIRPLINFSFCCLIFKVNYLGGKLGYYHKQKPMSVAVSIRYTLK